MKKRNQIMAITAAVTVLSASSAMAEYTPDQPVVDRGDGIMTTAVSTAEDYVVVVNGVQLEKKGYLDGDKVMIPVRALAEALGFDVEWVGESETVWLTRGANFITFQNGVDGYTFAKTAPIPLGKAPVIIDGTTFVPVNFAEEILHTTVTVDPNGTVTITDTEETAEPEANYNATVTEVGEESVVVDDTERGIVVLLNGEDTKFIGADGEEITISDLEEGMLVNVEYSGIMTASEPPQNVPVSITVVTEETPEIETVASIGEVLAVEGDQIVIGEDLEDPQTQIVFNTNEDTKFTKAGEEIGLEDIKAGDIINVVHSLAMTKSLPPQTYAYEIEVVDAEEGVLPETMELEGTIVEVEEGRVTIGDETDPNAQTILLVSEETEILDEDGNALELEDLAKGMEIKAVHKNMMTMSIPPQTPTLSITVIG